jgi:hypothetical protein
VLAIAARVAGEKVTVVASALLKVFGSIAALARASRDG